MANNDLGNTFRGRLLADSGSLTAPGIAFFDAQNSGISLINGVMTFSAGGIQFDQIGSGGFQLPDGTAAAPALNWSSSGSSNTGLFLKSQDVMAFSSDGTEAASFTATGSLSLINPMGIGGVASASAIANIGSVNPLAGVAQIASDAVMASSSAATTSTIGFQSDVTTAAAAYTSTTRAHFRANNTAKGAGSTITNDISFLALQPTQGGTGNAGLSDTLTPGGAFFIKQAGSVDNALGGALTVSGKLIGGGTATNDSAAAGVIGQVLSISRLKSAAVSATTATSLNVTAAALSLTAGDWDVSGAIGFLPAATTSVTILQAAISKTTAALPASDTLGVPTSGEVTMQVSTAANVMVSDTLVPLPTTRISLAGTTSIFLVANATFSVSTLTVYGSLNARRVR